MLHRLLRGHWQLRWRLLGRRWPGLCLHSRHGLQVMVVVGVMVAATIGFERRGASLVGVWVCRHRDTPLSRREHKLVSCNCGSSCRSSCRRVMLRLVNGGRLQWLINVGCTFAGAAAAATLGWGVTRGHGGRW